MIYEIGNSLKPLITNAPEEILIMAPKTLIHGTAGYFAGRALQWLGAGVTPASGLVFAISTIAFSRLFRALFSSRMEDWDKKQKYMAHYSITLFTAGMVTAYFTPFNLVSACALTALHIAITALAALIFAPEGEREIHATIP